MGRTGGAKIAGERTESGKVMLEPPGIGPMPGHLPQRAIDLMPQVGPIRAIHAPFQLGPRIGRATTGLTVHPRGFGDRRISTAQVPRLDRRNRHADPRSTRARPCAGGSFRVVCRNTARIWQTRQWGWK